MYSIGVIWQRTFLKKKIVLVELVYLYSFEMICSYGMLLDQNNHAIKIKYEFFFSIEILYI